MRKQNFLEVNNNHFLERVQHDKAIKTKPEEDHRRRTIIIEKQNSSYGFTLQSYGIHYKKDKEIEMITYVDYVEYDGPAFKAGLREGDVILSINGKDMEKANHMEIVSFIKNCDSNMRMVVLFEDCVRKVGLHMKYIRLKKLLEDKLTEYDKLDIQERSLLDGKWKTYSLPSRNKRNNNQCLNKDSNDSDLESDKTVPTAISSEDVDKLHKSSYRNMGPISTPTVILSYQYINPNAIGNNFVYKYIPTFPKNSHEKLKTRKNSTYGKCKKSHFCNPCRNGCTGSESGSVEAYEVSAINKNRYPSSVAIPTRRNSTKDSRKKSNNIEANFQSQCSLHSNSESYWTASNETLYWDGQSEVGSRQYLLLNKSDKRTKPKSWDNLATKSFGGYGFGFGYGYLETTPRRNNTKKLPKNCYYCDNYVPKDKPKSAENLLLEPEGVYGPINSKSCECLDNRCNIYRKRSLKGSKI